MVSSRKRGSNDEEKTGPCPDIRRPGLSWRRLRPGRAIERAKGTPREPVAAEAEAMLADVFAYATADHDQHVLPDSCLTAS